MVYDKTCYMGNDSGSYVQNNNTDPTILALLAVQGTGMSLGAILLAITIFHIIFYNSLSDKFINIQLHICLMMFASQVLIGIGFLVSPCQPLEIVDRKIFVDTCKAMSAVQFVFIVTSFNWKWIEAGYICHLVAKKCNSEYEKRELANKASQKQHQPETVHVPRKGLYRTFSKDITFNRASLNKEVKHVEKIKVPLKVEEIIKRAWYIKFFSKEPPSFWLLLIFGYIPPIILMGITFSTTPLKEAPPDDYNGPLNAWMKMNGIDVYCWPGENSMMIFYMVGAVVFITVGTLYLRFKAVQMVRLLRSGVISNDQQNNTVNSIIRWQRQNSGLERSIVIDDFYIRSSLIIMLVMLCTWIFGTLQSVTVWGLAIPFGTLCFLQGLIYFLFHVAKKYFKIFISR